MKKRMEQLINGKFEYHVPSLLLLEDRISVVTAEGQNYRGTLKIGTTDGSAVNGRLSSSNRRMVLAREQFSGNSVDIPYGFEVTGLRPGDRCKGELTVSTNIGEYKIPFSVKIKEQKVTTAASVIHSLDDFVQLASHDYREAFRLYTSKNFDSLFEGSNEKYRSLYETMSENPVTYQHLEEFLIGIHRKDKVELTLEDNKREFYELSESTKSILTIHKNTWGYLRAEVLVEGDFLEVEKKTISNDDFIGSVYGLEYIVKKEALGQGRKYGTITIRTVYGDKKFSVMASLNARNRVSLKKKENEYRYNLTKDLLDWRLNHLTDSEWHRRTFNLLENMKEDGSFNEFHMLYEAYMYYVEDRLDAAKEILKEFSEHSYAKNDWELAGYNLYLGIVTGFEPPENTRRNVQRLRELYNRREDSFGLLWVLLQVDEDLEYSAMKQAYYMERQYERGCRSPLLYLEACNLVKREITLLRKLSPFWKQVLHFAVENGLFDQELVLRVAYLATHEKRFDPIMYFILEGFYEKYPENEVLEAICKLVMKGQPIQREYFKWYQLAIDKELRITRIFELYVETEEENYQNILPKAVRLYFSYNNTLSDKKKAYIYANIIINKKQDKSTYELYRTIMQEFAHQKIMEGRFNQNYAVLYQEFLTEVKDAVLGEALCRVLFMHKIYCDDPKVCQVVVRHQEFAKEQVYPVVNGVAYVPVFTKRAQIAFLDVKKRRYYDTVPYSITRLMDSEDVILQCQKVEVHNPGLLLHVCESYEEELKISEENIQVYQNILKQNLFTKEYIGKIHQKLLEYYAHHADDDTMDEYLKQLDYKRKIDVNRETLIEILIDRGMYKDAFDLICQYGYEHVDPKKLLKLCSRMIENQVNIEDDELYYLAYFVFEQEVYNDVLLNFLITHFFGSIHQMEKVWEKARGFQLDVYELEERILTDAMFVREFPNYAGVMLQHYMQLGGKESVSTAYICFESYAYFLGYRQMEERVFLCLSHMCKTQENVTLICQMALIKYYTELPQLENEQKKLASQILGEFNEKGYRFAMLQGLPNELLLRFHLEDRVFAEQTAKPTDKVVLHYIRNKEDAKENEFVSETLQEMYQGIYSKEFVLFYGEKLTYYFTIEDEKQSIKTDKKTVEMRAATSTGTSKYQQINQMLAAWKLEDEEKLEEEIKRYLFCERLTELGYDLMD